MRIVNRVRRQWSRITHVSSLLLNHPDKILRNLLLILKFIWHTKILSRDLVVLFRPWGVGDVTCLLSCIPGLRRRHTNSWLVLITPPGCWRLVASSELADAAADRDSFFHSVVERACSPSLFYFATYPEGRVPEQAQTLHLADAFGRTLGVAPDLSCIRLRPSGRARHRMARRVSEVNPRGNPIVVFHPGATWPVKEWTHQSWCELAELIATNSEAVIIRIGTNVESNGRVRALEPVPHTIDWTNELDVTETAALLAEADALVGVDSGPLHLAGAVGCFSVGLFGPTSGHLIVHPDAPVALITAGVRCLGCHHSPMGHLHWKTGCPHDIICMRQISAKRVFEALAPYLGRKRNGVDQRSAAAIGVRSGTPNCNEPQDSIVADKNLQSPNA
jgi:hypothetical protein